MPIFRRKSPTFEAEKFDGENFERIIKLAPSVAYRKNENKSLVFVRKKDGTEKAVYPGNWVLRISDEELEVYEEVIFHQAYEEMNISHRHYDLTWFKLRCLELDVEMTEFKTRLILAGPTGIKILYYLPTGLAGPLDGSSRPVPCSPDKAVEWASGRLTK